MFNDTFSMIYTCGAIWLLLGLILLTASARGALIAYLVGPVTVALFWGLPLVLNSPLFSNDPHWMQMLNGMFGAAFLWGLVFVGVYLVFTFIESLIYAKLNKNTELPVRRFEALLFGQLGASVVFIFFGSDSGYELQSLLNAPLVPIIYYLRMDKPWNIYRPQAMMMIYPFLGAILYGGLGLLIGFIELKAFPATTKTTSEGESPVPSESDNP